MMRLDLDGLAGASREALMAEWREVVGRPPSKYLIKPLMVQILSHAYQLDTVGGYTKRLDSRLKTAARRDVVRMSIIIADVILKDSNFTQWYCGVSAPFSMCLHWPHFLILNLPQLMSAAANNVRLIVSSPKTARN